MNKGISKWPAKVLNLLVVLSMVIALCAVLATPVVAVAACDPTERHNGCNLEVFVNTYTKDAGGNFTAVSEITAGTPEDPNCFYVNAVVVNTGNQTGGNETNPCMYNAVINTGLYATLAVGETATKSAAEPIAQLGNVHMQEFWWKVCCDAAGNTTITVNASTSQCYRTCGNGTGSTVLVQTVPEGYKCLTIEIIEAPGLDDPLPQTISPSTDFGIKARITNNCDVTIGNVTGMISWTPDNLAVIVAGDQIGWDIGDLAPGEDEIVGWTLHCEAEGDILVSVNATGSYDGGTKADLGNYTSLINNPYEVGQVEVGRLEVTIDTPGNGTKIPTGCAKNTFAITATVKNIGATAVTDVWLTASASNAGVTITPPIQKGNHTIAGGGSATDSWTATCNSAGNTTILVSAVGVLIGGGAALGNASVDVYQKTLIVDFVGVYGNGTETPLVDPDEPYGVEGNVYDGQVNKCQAFQVVFRMYNYTATNWTDAQLSLRWHGNVTPAGGVYTRKVESGQTPGAWALHAASFTAGNTSDYYYNNQSNLEICACCYLEVKWTFECTNIGNVTFWAVGTKSAFTDTSREALVNQEWKAHLIGGMFTFLQDEAGFMQPREAFATSQNFHVVYPVVNTGNATAKDVVVNFKITQVVTGSYDLLGFSGDVVGNGTFDEGTGIGHAHLGDIEGGSAKKMILLLECTKAGNVMFWYSGAPAITGTDENTNAAIFWDSDILLTNILHPICSLTVAQIDFTVEILNPLEDENFKQSDNYVVKASVSNLSTLDLTYVNATISWGEDEPAELVDWVDGNQSATKPMGDIEAGRTEEITWEIHCTGEGDVTFLVTAISETPSLTARSDEVTVHQLPVPELEVLIVSPGPSDYDRAFTNTTIATGEPFAVTAMVMNIGGLDAEDVQVAIGDYDGDVTWYRTNATIYLVDECITPGSETIWVDDVEQVRDVDYTMNYGAGLGTFIHIPDEHAVVSATWLDRFSLVDSEMVQDIGTLGPLETKIVTWTLRAETTCDTGCEIGNESILVTAWASNIVGYVAAPMVSVDIYPAAHLVAEIVSITPASPFVVCEEFVVTYRVYNTGEADAWEVEAVLSVDPAGSVRIAEGEGGYTQYLGTIPGWSHYSGGYYYIEDTFTLHCKQACESTITITPKGNDECGWHWVWVYSGAAGYTPVWLYEDNRSYTDYGGYYTFVSLPGREIDAEFIEPASQTVKQVVSGGVDLSIDKTADNLFPTVGQTVKFTVVVTNTGPAEATGIVVSDAIPGNLTMSSHTKTQGTYTGGVWTVGSLAAGSSATLVINCTVGSVSAITNTATITALGQVDPFSDNNTDSVTLNLAAVTSMNIALKSGWNLISLPLIPNNSAIATVLAGVLGQVSIVYGYDPSTGWKSYIPGGPTPSLTTMVDGKGYWINMTAAATLTVNGVVNPLPPTTPPAYSVAAGWNLIGFKSTTAMTAGDYLAAIAGQWTRIWGYTNGQYGAVTSSGMLQPGGGYWIAVTSAGTIFP